MEQESKVVVLHCRDNRGREIEKYKVYAQSVTFNFESGATVRKLAVVENDREIFHETLGECVIPERGGNLVIDMSKVEF